MKKIILLLIIVIIIAGCGSEEQLDKESADSEEVKTASPIEEEVATKGKVEFDSKAKTSLVVIDSPLDIDLAIKGDVSYEIDESNGVKGSGKGSFDIDLASDIGIAKCTSTETIPITYDIKGSYDKSSNQISYKSSNIKPSSTTVVLDCPSAEYGDISYDLALPISSFIGTGEELVIKHEDQAVSSKKILHPIEGWDISIESQWTFKTLLVYEEFDFDVDVDPAIVSVVQGETATPLVTVRKVRGQAKDVSLTVTSWPNIKAFLVNKVVTPTETTTLTIETSCDTAPDNYLFTVQGETAGTFKTSVDSVSVQVTKNPQC
ncbi:MAG: hypothetical protein V3V78_04550 [Candidatus Woesearchaeota archaeon]